jgi:hypothetical protein
MSARSIENQALRYIKTHCAPPPQLFLETRNELHAFFAGVASACQIIFGRPVTHLQAAACVLGVKDYFGNPLESLNDDGILRVVENKDGATTYELTSPVAISPALAKSQYDAIVNTPIRNTRDDVRYEVAEDGE